MLSVRSDLAAQTGDVDVDGAVEDDDLVAPDTVENLLAGEDHAAMGEEQGEEMFSAESTGIFNIIGLDAGTYYLKETKVPSGYQLLGKTITIEVGRNEATFTIPGDEGERPIVKTVQLDTNTATYSFSVANKPLPDLPSSGSNGTLVMMSTGFAAIVLAGTNLSKRFGHLWN